MKEKSTAHQIPPAPLFFLFMPQCCNIKRSFEKLTNFMKTSREANTKAIGIRDYEISKTIVPIGNRNDNLYSYFFCQIPIMIYVWNHNSNVSYREFGRIRQFYFFSINFMVCREFCNIEMMIFPCQFYKIACITKHFKP
jgi:hypothetical protein